MTIEIDRNLISKILNRPDAPALVEELTNELAREQKKRKEFYNQITTEELKTEFINGEIIIQSPVKKKHNEYSLLLSQLLNIYVTKHDAGFVGIEKIMISLTRNDYEPDVCYFNKQKAKSFKDNQSLFPAPDFIAEFLSKKTAKRDRGIKFEDYERHGVQEYWIIDPIKKVIEQYQLQGGKYQLIKKSNSGTITLSVLNDFQFPIAAIFDKQKNLEVIANLIGK